MNIRFYVTICIIIAISFFNAFMNHRNYIEKKRNCLSIVAVVAVATIVGGWDVLATMLAIVTYFALCYFYIVIAEASLVFALLGVAIFGGVGMLLFSYLEPVEISREVSYEERTQLSEVDDYFIKTDVDKNNLYYIYYIEDDEGIEANKVDSYFTKVIYDSSDEAYLETEYDNITYVNNHFGGMTFVEKHMFQGYLIHIPEGRIR